VAHLLKPVEALAVEIDELGLDPDRISLEQLALIGDVHLRRHGGDAAPLDHVEAELDRLISGVETLVERLQVIGDVHMPVAVDPFRTDVEVVAHERGGDSPQDVVWAGVIRHGRSFSRRTMRAGRRAVKRRRKDGRASGSTAGSGASRAVYNLSNPVKTLT